MASRNIIQTALTHVVRSVLQVFLTKMFVGLVFSSIFTLTGQPIFEHLLIA